MHSISSMKIERVNLLKYSTVAILSVFFVETVLGLIAGSLAILSDGLHALFDVISSFVLFISARASLKPPDEEHMYGHEKFEALGSLIGGLTLIVLATLIAIEALLKIFGGGYYINLNLSFVGFIALGYTFSIDLFRMFIFRPALKGGGGTIRVGFYHALLDVGSTLIALLGFLLATFGVFYWDSIASLILSSSLVFISFRLVWSSIMELSDVAPREIVKKVKEEMLRVSGGLLKYEGLKVRKAGEKVFVRATLKVPDYMSLKEAHELSSKMEARIMRAVGDADISFHIEPASIRGLTTEKFIEKLAGRIRGVRGVHNVSVTHYGGKLYATLHVQVEPSTPLSDAHDLAEKIERKIAENLSNVGNVLVHIEPSNIELKKGQIIDEREINDVVKLAAKRYEGELKIKRVITYTANGKRYIDVECVLSGEISVEEAHKIASEIENLIRERFSETIVTVHMEPKTAEIKK